MHACPADEFVKQDPEILLHHPQIRVDARGIGAHGPAVVYERRLGRWQMKPELAGMTTVVVSGLGARKIEVRAGIPEGIPVLAKPIDFARLLDIATVVADRKRHGAPASS